jgi:hypothetical protein
MIQLLLDLCSVVKRYAEDLIVVIPELITDRYLSTLRLSTPDEFVQL